MIHNIRNYINWVRQKKTLGFNTSLATDVLVFPAASKPSIRIRISLLPKIFLKMFPMIANQRSIHKIYSDKPSFSAARSSGYTHTSSWRPTRRSATVFLESYEHDVLSQIHTHRNLTLDVVRQKICKIYTTWLVARTCDLICQHT